MGRDTQDGFWKYLCKQNNILARECHQIDIEAPRHRNEDFATFTLEGVGQVVEVGQPLDLLFRVVMKPVFVETSLCYGFNQVRLKLHRPPKSKLLFVNQLGAQDKPYRIKTATLEARGGLYNPEWFLKVEGTALDGEFHTTDTSLCEIHKAEIGETITGEIAVHQHDGSLVEATSGEKLLDHDKDIVLQALCAATLEGVQDRAGWIVLGTQTIRILRGEV